MREVCPNCGSDRPDRYCSRCGQNNRDYMRGLWAVAYEFVREMFELDSRLLRTVRFLLFKPGHLSSEFSRNRRAAYMSPVRLYLFTSFVFFLVLSISARGLLSNLNQPEGDDPVPDIAADGALADIPRAIVDSTLAVVDDVFADRVPEVSATVSGALGDSALADSALADGALAAEDVVTGILADSALAAAEDVVADTLAVGSLAAADGGLAGSEAGTDGPMGDTTVLRIVTAADSAAGAETGETALPPAQIEAFKARLRPEQARRLDDILGRPDGFVSKQMMGVFVSVWTEDEPEGGTGWLAGYLRGLVIDLFHDPEGFLQQAIGNLPVAMFFLLPVFALILAACYMGKKRFFVEHLVFGMHVHTFVFLMLAAALLAPDERPGAWVQLFFALASPLYVLIALRRFYGDGWGRTLVKAFVVWNLYSLVLVPGLLIAFLVRG